MESAGHVALWQSLSRLEGLGSVPKCFRIWKTKDLMGMSFFLCRRKVAIQIGWVIQRNH
jgi:hypothetical protein